MDLNEKTELFHKETGIWPPGRDMPAAMCGGEDIYLTRRRAYDYWCKACATQNALKLEVGFVKKANEQLQTELVCANEMCGGYEAELAKAKAENKKQYDKGFLEGTEAQEAANRKHIIEPLQAENEWLKDALKEIADTTCYHPTDRTCPQIAQQALKG